MTLDQCGDVLTIKELCAVLQISESRYYRFKRHGAFPIRPLQGFPNRYSKSAVLRYLTNSADGRRK
jgi:predicted DNA-binding transcriptional regulator AlpA